jgi:periplasmic protein TonB
MSTSKIPFPQDDDEDESFFKRHGVKTVVLTVTGIATAWWVSKTDLSSPPAGPKRVEQALVEITLPPMPPPPPPPPPKPEPQQEEEKMEEQAPVDEPEDKPEDAPPPDEPPVSTGIVGNGPGDGSLSAKGGGSGNTLGGTGRRSASKYGWYASQVQRKIADVLRTNQTTKKASMRLDVKIWADTTGRVTKAALAGSTGNAQLDQTIKNEILTGLQLDQPPPTDMKMPINMRITATRP